MSAMNCMSLDCPNEGTIPVIVVGKTEPVCPEHADGMPGARQVEPARAKKLYVMEHKTSSEDVGPGSVYWRKLTLDAQISIYYAGARSLGHEPDGVLYDVLRKPALRPLEANSKRKEPESPAAYRDRCVTDIAERPDHYYQRGVVVRLEDEEVDAAYDAWQTAEQVRASRNANRWPRNPDACTQYSRMCDYWEVCSGGASIDDPLLFERDTENPHRELDGKSHLPMLTSSSARTYRACARRYKFAYEMGVKARSSKGTRSFGKMIHTALEAWMLGGGDLDAAMATLCALPLDHDVAKAQAMIAGYHARWSEEPLEVIAVEKEFQAALVNPETGAKSRTFTLAGKLDAIVRKAA
jgi:hypothetical protein